MNRLQWWLADRDHADEQAVVEAIGMLRPSQASAPLVALLTRMRPGKAVLVLARLEQAGRVTSDWADGPDFHRRLYRVVSSAVPR